MVLSLERESDFGKAEMLVSKFNNTVRVFVGDEGDAEGDHDGEPKAARIFLHKTDVLRLIAYLNEIVKDME